MAQTRSQTQSSFTQSFYGCVRCSLLKPFAFPQIFSDFPLFREVFNTSTFAPVFSQSVVKMLDCAAWKMVLPANSGSQASASIESMRCLFPCAFVLQLVALGFGHIYDTGHNFRRAIANLNLFSSSASSRLMSKMSDPTTMNIARLVLAFSRKLDKFDLSPGYCL